MALPTIPAPNTPIFICPKILSLPTGRQEAKMQKKGEVEVKG
jgi:hypothetical protein